MSNTNVGRCAAAAAVFALVMASSVASAQATRTWVSGTGNDADPCSRVMPCKTFAGAIAKTAPGGEIDVVRSGIDRDPGRSRIQNSARIRPAIDRDWLGNRELPTNLSGTALPVVS